MTFISPSVTAERVDIIIIKKKKKKKKSKWQQEHDSAFMKLL